MRVVACLAVLGIALSAAAAPDYDRAGRASYVQRALDALRQLGTERVDALRGELRRGGRKACRAGFGGATTGCLLEMARETCAGRPEAERARCRLVADVILTNQMSEDDFVDRATRVALVNQSRDFRAAMRAELRGRYAALVANMLLTRAAGRGESLPDRIDRFCVHHARTHALAWHRCVAAVVWYIGTTDSGEAP